MLMTFWMEEEVLLLIAQMVRRFTIDELVY